jgi:serine/threonine protein kinase
MSEREIFTAALNLTDPTERSAYLDRVCGDAALRQRVELLLRTHGTAGDFLQLPAVRLAASAVPPDDPSALGPSPDGDDAATARSEEPSEDDFRALLQPATRAGTLGRLRHYEVLEVLGRGGFSIVVRAFDDMLQRVVATKIMDPELAATSPARKRFLREARAAAAVRHENVVTIHAVEEQPIPYLVMEYIAGETLQQKLDRDGPLDVPEVLRIGVQVARGLAAAHALGLVHRDVKPSNILLERGSDRVKISDFGLARTADDASLSQSGFIAGTPLYMAPEQARGESLDRRADLFSLGSVLYVMCTGRPPFRAPTTLAVLQRVAEDTPRPIREIIPEVPEWLCALIARLHAKKPDDRFASAQEVADLLAGFQTNSRPVGGEPTANVPRLVPAPRPTSHEAARNVLRPPRARRRWLIAAAVLLLLLAGWGLTEAAGVTDVRGTVIRLFSPEGTLVVEVDDPAVSVAVDGADVVITGAGAKEIRLKPGQYRVEASKDGQVVRRELVTVSRNGRQVVRVSKESAPPSAAWEKSVAALPAEEQVRAVVLRLKELNPGFDGQVKPDIRDGQVTGLWLKTHSVTDLSPVRALPRLESLECTGTVEAPGRVTDLSPLRGLPLKTLHVYDNPVSDLSPLTGMPLQVLECFRTQVGDLTPLKGMPLTVLYANGTRIADLSPLKGLKLTRLLLQHTSVSDLSPLKGMNLGGLDVSYTQVSDLSALEGMPLPVLDLAATPVSDLSPLKGMKLKALDIRSTQVTDLSPLIGMPLKSLGCDFQRERDAEMLRSLTTLERINDKPAADFWKERDGK